MVSGFTWIWRWERMNMSDSWLSSVLFVTLVVFALMLAVACLRGMWLSVWLLG
nr:MAG TPA: hypothetical protein [Caudoviricetes sp.]